MQSRSIRQQPLPAGDAVSVVPATFVIVGQLRQPRRVPDVARPSPTVVRPGSRSPPPAADL
jgi:hypothetical protein